MHSFRQDIRQTFRNIARAPTYFGAAILTLAIGIGANTAIFSIVETVLLNPLPYPDSHRLVTIGDNPWTPAEVVLDLERATATFAEVAAFYPRRFTVTGGEQPAEVEGAQVSANFFQLFRAGLASGRTFAESDARPDAPRTAIISYSLWQRQYGRSPDVVGRTVQVDGVLHEIIGVVDRGFRQFAPRSEEPHLWIPFGIRPTGPDGSMSWAIPLARLGSGVSLEQAQAVLDASMRRFRERNPQAEPPALRERRLATLKSELIRNARPALFVLQLAVGVVLLLACVNVANLLLVRFGSRQGELAIRSALGASRQTLVRQLVTESMVLSLLGGLAGLLLVMVSLRLVLAVVPPDVPRIGEVSVDLTVFLFALATSMGTGLFFGVVPALVTTRQAPSEFLKAGSPRTAGAKQRHRLSQGLVIAEITVTLILLVGAGLLVRTFLSLTNQVPGFRTEDVLSVSMHVPENRYQSVAELEEFYRRIVERLRQVPGLESVGMSNNLPISRGSARREYLVEGESEVRESQYGVISPGYFRTLAIPLLSGRDFSDADRRGNPPVAIIDEAMWREIWPQQDPIGRRFRFNDGEDVWLTVVGVVGNIRGSGLASDPRPGFYISYQQRPETVGELAVGRNTVILARAEAGAGNLAEPLRRAIWDVDPLQPVPPATTLESILSAGVHPQRFRAVLVGSFAAIALILVVAGIYGVIEFLVSERTHEFGIRMAVGATTGDIVQRVLSWGLRLAASGLVLGTIGIVIVNRYLASMLFGVTPTDPVTTLTSAAAIIVVALAACVIPARKATGIDPVEVLRR